MAEEQRRLRMILREAVAASKQPVRDLERAIGLGSGNLARLLDGRQVVRIHHLVNLARILSVPPGEFLEMAFPDESAGAKYHLRDWIEPKPAAPAVARDAALADVVRQVVREELSRLQGPPPAAE
jgi:transcriptional regulator with XRE-family HTH domain